MSDFKIRPAAPEDVPLLFQFVRELAEYENLTDQVTATEDSLRQWIFEEKKAGALIGEENGLAVGYVIYFYNFSSFVGRAGIFIEDLYVRPSYRKKGYGKAFFKYIAALARDEGCRRLEWTCLDWNKPSIDFYLSLGAQAADAWSIYRLGEKEIQQLAQQ